ncbi:MAG TPA: hypothetical protein VN890_04830 [Methylocella sp.]|nr:hypothetical protein [Methylocella sp.]
MRLEQVAEILFDQALARLTSPQDYVLLDALCDDDCGWFARSRYRNPTGFRRSDGRAFDWFSDHHLPDFDDRTPAASDEPTAQ